MVKRITESILNKNKVIDKYSHFIEYDAGLWTVCIDTNNNRVHSVDSKDNSNGTTPKIDVPSIASPNRKEYSIHWSGGAVAESDFDLIGEFMGNIKMAMELIDELKKEFGKNTGNK